ncbi:MAG: TonB-dependent receptor [Pseudomonadota bacterium]|nr:TonB-dependent receptor [Pseudomonadota bacterium]
MSEVLVTGHTLAEQRSVQVKKDSALISDNLSADEAGSLPDFGLGQALKRLPGISMVINNGRGEEQYMTIRGLSPDYNSTTLDGIPIPSTELGSSSASTSTASGRTTSYDVLPTAIAKTVNVFKSWEANLPSDAIGGVTNIVTRSAFDAPGGFLAGAARYAYWEDEPRWHAHLPSGEVQFTASDVFGSDQQFGALLSGTYYRRSSSSWDTVSNGTQGFYPYTGGVQTLSATTLTPSTDVKGAGLTNVPGQTGWLNYDDMRTRESVFAKLEYRGDDLKLHLTGGYFDHLLNEDRNSQYLDASGKATFTTATTGSFATGTASEGYDHYDLDRRITFGEFGGEYDLHHGWMLDAAANLSRGRYNQSSIDDAFSYKAAASSLAFNYITSTTGPAVFKPLNDANYLNPANYNLSYHQIADNGGSTRTPIFKIDASWNEESGATGPGVRLGLFDRNPTNRGSATQTRYDAPAAVTMASLGSDTLYLTPYNGGGQQVLISSPGDIAGFFAANQGRFKLDAGNLSASTIGNYELKEDVAAGYGILDYRAPRYYLSAGIRYELTDVTVQNHLPSSFTSSSTATSFTEATTKNDYGRWLPALNASYDLASDLKARLGVSRDLARPDYSQLAQNTSVTVATLATATTTGVASQTISNPKLIPRESANYDLSLEWYPTSTMLLSLALFDKQISHEIVTVSNQQIGVTELGEAGVYTVTTTQSQNTDRAGVQGVELGLVMPHLIMLPAPLSYFGLAANTSYNNYDASHVRMTDGSMRHLPGLISSARSIDNASLLFDAYPWDGSLAFNHTSKMPYSFSATNSALDVWYGASNRLDGQLRYHVSKGFSAVIQVQNITNDTPTRRTGPNVNIYSETLENGRAYFVGFDFQL